MEIGKDTRWISFATPQQTPSSSAVAHDTAQVRVHSTHSIADEKQFGSENFWKYLSYVPHSYAEGPRHQTEPPSRRASHGANRKKAAEEALAQEAEETAALDNLLEKLRNGDNVGRRLRRARPSAVSMSMRELPLLQLPDKNKDLPPVSALGATTADIARGMLEQLKTNSFVSETFMPLSPTTPSAPRRRRLRTGKPGCSISRGARGGSLVNAQSANDTTLGTVAIEAHFTKAELVPELLSTFTPSTLMNVTFSGVGSEHLNQHDGSSNDTLRPPNPSSRSKWDVRGSFEAGKTPRRRWEARVFARVDLRVVTATSRLEDDNPPQPPHRRRKPLLPGWIC
ncbi:hypothetical protein F5888DRAFT_1889356, partial [Russula emetica]